MDPHIQEEYQKQQVIEEWLGIKQCGYDKCVNFSIENYDPEVFINYAGGFDRSLFIKSLLANFTGSYMSKVMEFLNILTDNYFNNKKIYCLTDLVSLLKKEITNEDALYFVEWLNNEGSLFFVKILSKLDIFLNEVESFTKLILYYNYILTVACDPEDLEGFESWLVDVPSGLYDEFVKRGLINTSNEICVSFAYESEQTYENYDNIQIPALIAGFLLEGGRLNV